MEAAIEKGLLKDADEPAATDDLLRTAREIAADTTMMAANAEAFLSGAWDDQLPRVMREIASGRLKTIELQNREQGLR
jgi:hypothetical protein